MCLKHPFRRALAHHFVDLDLVAPKLAQAGQRCVALARVERHLVAQHVAQAQHPVAREIGIDHLDVGRAVRQVVAARQRVAQRVVAARVVDRGDLHRLFLFGIAQRKEPQVAHDLGAEELLDEAFVAVIGPGVLQHAAPIAAAGDGGKPFAVLGLGRLADPLHVAHHGKAERIGVDAGIARMIVARLEQHARMAVQDFEHRAVADPPLLVQLVEDVEMHEAGAALVHHLRLALRIEILREVAHDPEHLPLPRLQHRAVTFEEIDQVLFGQAERMAALGGAGLVVLRAVLARNCCNCCKKSSFVLAGVLLKMGGYGLIRINVSMFPDVAVDAAVPMAILALISILYGAMVTFRQTDVKRLIAYSSVSHMGFVLLGISSIGATAGNLSPIGLTGAAMQLFTHGTITGLLFVMVGVVYDKAHTRHIPDLGGLAARMPIAAIAFMIAGLASLGLPGTSGFAAEIMVFLGTFPVHGGITALATVGVLLAAGYVLWTVQQVLFGPQDERWVHLTDVSPIEAVAPTLLMAAILIVGIYPALLSDVFKSGINDLILRLTG